MCMLNTDLTWPDLVLDSHLPHHHQGILQSKYISSHPNVITYKNYVTGNFYTIQSCLSHLWIIVVITETCPQKINSKFPLKNIRCSRDVLALGLSGDCYIMVLLINCVTVISNAPSYLKNTSQCPFIPNKFIQYILIFYNYVYKMSFILKNRIGGKKIPFMKCNSEKLKYENLCLLWFKKKK